MVRTGIEPVLPSVHSLGVIIHKLIPGHLLNIQSSYDVRQSPRAGNLTLIALRGGESNPQLDFTILLVMSQGFYHLHYLAI